MPTQVLLTRALGRSPPLLATATMVINVGMLFSIIAPLTLVPLLFWFVLVAPMWCAAHASTGDGGAGEGGGAKESDRPILPCVHDEDDQACMSKTGWRAWPNGFWTRTRRKAHVDTPLHGLILLVYVGICACADSASEPRVCVTPCMRMHARTRARAHSGGACAEPYAWRVRRCHNFNFVLRPPQGSECAPRFTVGCGAGRVRKSARCKGAEQTSGRAALAASPDSF